MTSGADCKRQGIGLYYSWLSNRSQRYLPGDSTNDVSRRTPRGGLPRDVTTIHDDVTRRYGEFPPGSDAAAAASKTDLNRWITDRNPPAAGRRIRHRLDPLIQDRDPPPPPHHHHHHHQQQQQQLGLPRQRRRRRRPTMTSRTDFDDKETPTSRGFYTTRGIPVTSRAALGDLTSFLTVSRDLSRSPDVAMTSSFSPRRRKADDAATWWSKSYAGVGGNGGRSPWNVPGLMLESSARMSCLQLKLVDEQHNVSLVQVTIDRPINQWRLLEKHYHHHRRRRHYFRQLVPRHNRLKQQSHTKKRTDKQ